MMRLSHNHFISCYISALFLMLIHNSALALVIDFDDIDNTTLGYSAIPENYSGLSWSRELGVVSDSYYSRTYGNTYGSPSGQNAAFNGGGILKVSVSDNTPFIFKGASFSGWGYSNAVNPTYSATSITVEGYNQGQLVGSKTMGLSSSKYQWLQANLQGVDQLRFTSSHNEGWWLMDDLTLKESPPTLTATVFYAADPADPEAGNALGKAVKYYKNDVYQATLDAYEDCAFNDNPPGCDPYELKREHDIGAAKFAADLTIVGGEAEIALTTGAITAGSSVDMDYWNATEVGRFVNLTQFLDDVRNSFINTMDFFKELFISEPEAQPQTLAAQALAASVLDPIIINSITGTVFWDPNGAIDWFLSDLMLNVDIAKDYLTDISIGQTFSTVSSLFPGSEAFGVFKAESIVDPPGYNMVEFSFRQVDVMSSQVPEPATLTLFGLGLVGLGAMRRRKLLR